MSKDQQSHCSPRHGEICYTYEKRSAESNIEGKDAARMGFNAWMLMLVFSASRYIGMMSQGKLNAMMYADSPEQALKERRKFEHAFGHNPKVVRRVVEN